MKKDERILSELMCLAEDIDHSGSRRLPRIAAAVVYRKEIVGYGVCCRRSDPLQKKFGRTPDAIYLHAEISAIKNAIKRERSVDFLRSSTLYVARAKIIGGEFVSGLAKPCAGCQRAISAFNIPKVIWTEDMIGG